ncbi:MAG: 3-phenylpropionate/trans-cinnamate dioxygenase ferredoxin component [Frankiaceae bacterium]|jgi:3-phenylpropionate/trans-cinnamate dioxygenase ferredoxin subunit|nr:3-phenylpropionate/trans-cinnamate dioxygenase ferredoxin component [Frankiaceae bacterium]
MSGYLFACRVADLADESAIGVELDGVPICLAKSEGEIFAISDICSHADIALSEGEVGEGTVECWLHGSRFDLRSGQPTGLPANRPVPTYPVKIDGDDVLVAVKEI